MVKIFLYLLLFSTIGCQENFQRPNIGEKISSPIDLIFHKGQYIVLNAGGSYNYKTGSVLLLSTEGKKLFALETPRLGRSLYQNGDSIIATFESQETGSEDGLLEVYHTSENKIQREKTFILPKCQPVQGIIDSQSQQIIASCVGGKILAGSLNQKTMITVRDYHSKGKFTFRTLYLDAQRKKLFGFVSDFGNLSLKDQILTSSPESSGAPDINFNNDIKKRRLEEYGSAYQYFVLDLTQNLTPKTWENNKNELDQELKWFDFILPEDPELTKGTKYFRTNFWHAAADPSDQNVFYLSHRGSFDLKKHRSNILKITVHDDSSLTVNRAFSSEARENQYFTKFEVLNNNKGFLVNTFHDLINFDTKQNYEIFFENQKPHQSNNLENSYYHLALNEEQEQFLVISYFDNSLRLFEAKSGQPIKFLKRII